MQSHRLISIVAVLLAAARADAANEIVNGNFDTSVVGWFGIAEFTAGLDSFGDPSRGSLRVTNPTPNSGTQAIQHIPVTAGVPIRASFQVRIASGQSGIGYAYPGVNFIEGDCGTSNVYLSFVNAQLVSQPFDTWVDSEMPEVIAPAGAGCAEVVLFVRNDGSSGTFAANFDTIFAPEPGSAACGLVAIAAIAVGRRAARRATAPS